MAVTSSGVSSTPSSQAFAKYDVDRSGALTKDECYDLVNAKGLSVSRQYLEGVWSVFDQNGDGTLDEREFALLFSVLTAKSDTRRPTIVSATQTRQPFELASMSTQPQPFELQESAERLGYFGELARRSRAGEGSREIIACSVVFLLAILLLLALLFSVDETPVENDSADTGGSSPELAGGENLWWVGVAMSCVACLANSFGYNLVRKAHTLVEERQAAGETEFRVRDTWQFPVGWFCMVVLCAVLDTFALSFTDPALIAPLSGLTLVLNVWVAQFINDEQVVPLDSAVTSLILAGVIITITNGPAGAVPSVDADYLWSQLFRPSFLFYEVVMHGSALVVHQYCVKPLYGDMTENGIKVGRQQNPRLNTFAPVLLPWVGAVYTAHMNVSVAVLLGYLKGPKPAIFFEFGPYFCAAALAISCYIQLSAINNGLKAEGALVFVPIKSAFNVAQVSLASTTFFETLETMGGLQTARYLVGLGSVIFGVLLITLRPDTKEGGNETRSHSEAVRPNDKTMLHDGSLNESNRGQDAATNASKERPHIGTNDHVENPVGHSYEWRESSRPSWIHNGGNFLVPEDKGGTHRSLALSLSSNGNARR